MPLERAIVGRIAGGLGDKRLPPIHTKHGLYPGVMEPEAELVPWMGEMLANAQAMPKTSRLPRIKQMIPAKAMPGLIPDLELYSYPELYVPRSFQLGIGG